MDGDSDRGNNKLMEPGSENESPPADGRPRLGFLEIIYGVLFDPRRTMEIVAKKPPIGFAFLVFAVLLILQLVMGQLAASRTVLDLGLANFLSFSWGLLPLMAVCVFLFGFVKWFSYSAVVHLTAEFLGGHGSAKGVFVVIGLAGLPEIFLIPINLLPLFLGPASWVIIAPAWLAIMGWGLVLQVFGLMHVHGLTSGRSALAVLAPFLLFIILLLFLLALLAAIVAAAAMPFDMSGYDYF